MAQRNRDLDPIEAITQILPIERKQFYETGFTEETRPSSSVQDCVIKSLPTVSNIDPKIYTPTRIEISPPDENKEVLKETTPHQLQKLVDSLFRCNTNQLNSIEKALSLKTDTIIFEKQQEAAKLFEAAEKTHQGNFWDFLKMIAGAILGTVSIIVGGTLIALGGPIGWASGSFLIGSGITSISATILAQVGINTEITSVIGLISAGMGLVGSIGSFFTTTHSLPHLIASLANAVFTVASGASTISSQEMKRQLSEINYEMTKIKKELNLDDVSIKQLALQAQNIAEDMYKDAEHCQQIMTKREECKRRIVSLQAANTISG
jgi:hypothetical protein